MWRVDITLPGDEQRLGSLELQVAELLPQELESSLDELPRQLVLDGTAQEITVGIQGKWLFGAAAAGEKAQLISEIRRVENYPPGWYGWYFGDRHGLNERSERVSFHRKSHQGITLDAAGKGSWQIKPSEILGASQFQWPEGVWKHRLIGGVRAPAAGRFTITTPSPFSPAPTATG